VNCRLKVIKVTYQCFFIRTIFATLFVAMCFTPALSVPANRRIDNSIDGYEKIQQQNMPAHVKETFPNLIEITKKLTQLYINGNQMRLSADVFAEADQLEMIDLSGGDLIEIESRAFYGPTKLKKLNLSNNKLTSLPRDLFPQRNAMKELDLSNNQIARLSRSSFKNLGNLRKLDLTNNAITQLDGFIFADLVNLQELDLSGNPIQSISEEFFASLPNGLQLSFDDHSLDFNSLQLTEQWAL